MFVNYTNQHNNIYTFEYQKINVFVIKKKLHKISTHLKGVPADQEVPSQACTPRPAIAAQGMV